MTHSIDIKHKIIPILETDKLIMFKKILLRVLNKKSRVQLSTLTSINKDRNDLNDQSYS